MSTRGMPLHCRQPAIVRAKRELLEEVAMRYQHGVADLEDLISACAEYLDAKRGGLKP